MPKKTSIGGQAVIEGVMMKGPDKAAVAVRKPDGEIQVDIKKSIPYNKRNKFLALPIIRGAAALVDSLVNGIKYLEYSASFYDDGTQEEESKFDLFIKKTLGDKAEKVAMVLSLLVSFGVAIALFMVLPTFVANFLKKAIDNTVIINLIEGLIRIIIFVIYIYFISKLKDIQRVFEYHGAEHKTIFCYESGIELTPENAAKFGRLHPRCGTNFLIVVMFVSIIVFSFMGWPGIIMRVVSRVVFLPLIAGLSYEVIKWMGRSDSKLVGILAYPGLMMQKLTTREPDESQLEVAIAALKAVIPEGGNDNW